MVGENREIDFDQFVLMVKPSDPSYESLIQKQPKSISVSDSISDAAQKELTRLVLMLMKVAKYSDRLVDYYPELIKMSDPDSMKKMLKEQYTVASEEGVKLLIEFIQSNFS